MCMNDDPCGDSGDNKTEPQHNKYDNIFKIRQKGYPTEEQLAEALRDPKGQVGKIRYTELGRGVIMHDIEAFLQRMARGNIKLPIWKILCPSLNREGGAIYYIFEDLDYHSFAFRGTYGYWGTGCHESAMIEALAEKLGLQFEVRDGDYLLNFFQ